MRAAVASYHAAAAGAVDFAPLLADLDALTRAIREWRARADARVTAGADAATRRALNATIRRIARLLVPLNYAKGERFDHDPALKLGPVPKLEAATSLAAAPPELQRFMQVGLTRELNKVRATLRAVHRELAQ